MIDVMSLKPGDVLALRGGIKAVVTENMEDGQWVQVRYLHVPDRPDEVDVVELCHSGDIVRQIDEDRE